ncbi:MAG TPA: hypothetical protein VGV07_20170 [Devosia sp.]|jgi:hypothetical protein|uniref:hypothetical protein n=1 Tax=Devosia sp. TaxID=1871048 RepID=UPI002DDCFFA0|nr:hypothetical protein [Devosia sp.]HEV2517582.1 hypothetical protein [Devosia sp.]
MTIAERLPTSLAAAANDRLADFCLWPYEPLGPTAGALRSEAVLWAAAQLDPAGGMLTAVIGALQDELGRGQTVWGIKAAGGRLSYEFYFYDYGRAERQVSLQRVLACLARFVPCRLSIPDERPYFMFSIDLEPQWLAARRPIDEVNLYFGNPSGDLSSGLSYRLTETGLEFANLYHFFHTREDAAALRRKLITSARLDDAEGVADQLLEQHRLGIVTVVANKRQSDGIYYSRVSAAQMADFVVEHHYPQPFAQFVQTHLNRFQHLYFDLGVDYAMVDGSFEVRKTAIYGFA